MYRLCLGPGFVLAFILLTGVSAQDNAPDKSAGESFDFSRLQKELQGYTGSGETSGVVQQQAGQQQQDRSLIGVTIRLSIVMGIIIVLVFAVAWLLKRGGISGTHSKGGSIDVLEAASLGPQRTVVLVRVLDTVYVLGQTQHTITLLEKLQDEKAMEVISSAREVTSLSRFKDVFNSFVAKHQQTNEQ